MSTKTGTPTHVGFPPPLLGWEPLRLPVLARGPGYIALEKPSGPAPAAHRWYPRAPDVEAALQHQISEGKPELARLDLTPGKRVRAPFSYSPEFAGVALYGVMGEDGANLANDYGSTLLELVFHFLARDNATEEAMEVDLPLAEHSSKPHALISHQTGKKALTQFRRLEQIGSYGWWEARIRYFRMDQLRVHAKEVGLSVVGDRYYGRENDIRLSNLKRNWSGDPERETPLYEGLCVHLAEVRWRIGGAAEPIVITSTIPPRMNTLLKKLRQYR